MTRALGAGRADFLVRNFSLKLFQIRKTANVRNGKYHIVPPRLLTGAIAILRATSVVLTKRTMRPMLVLIMAMLLLLGQQAAATESRLPVRRGLRQSTVGGMLPADAFTPPCYPF